MTVPVLFGIPRSAIFFGSFTLGKQLQTGGIDRELSPFELFNAGAFAGAIRGVIMIPTERVKCILQVSKNEK